MEMRRLGTSRIYVEDRGKRERTDSLFFHPEQVKGWSCITEKRKTVWRNFIILVYGY